MGFHRVAESLEGIACSRACYRGLGYWWFGDDVLVYHALPSIGTIRGYAGVQSWASRVESCGC